MPISDQLIQRIHQTKQNNIHGFFDKIKTKKWVKDLYETLFLPQNENTEDQLKRNFEALQETLSDQINTVTGNKNLTEKLVRQFLPVFCEQKN